MQRLRSTSSAGVAGVLAVGVAPAANTHTLIQHWKQDEPTLTNTDYVALLLSKGGGGSQAHAHYADARDTLDSRTDQRIAAYSPDHHHEGRSPGNEDLSWLRDRTSVRNWHLGDGERGA